MELHKGYFPHHFNTLENQNKIFDSYPSIEYYGDKFKSVKDRNDFLSCNSKQNGILNFDEQLYKYCLSDVEIYIKLYHKCRRDNKILRCY